MLNHPEKYHVNLVIKPDGYHVGRNEKIPTLPLYMAVLLTEY